MAAKIGEPLDQIVVNLLPWHRSSDNEILTRRRFRRVMEIAGC
ncbi:hypothetical protein [Sphingomonas paucimobilis]|nr:hypothetical protein [Sphingomonas paucimobilis]